MPIDSEWSRLTLARRRLLDRLLDRLLECDELQRAHELSSIAMRAPRVHRWLVELLAASTEPTNFLDTMFERVGQAARQEVLVRDEVKLSRGTCLGPWRIEEAVGSGGMGTVYRALRADGAFEMEAAVKLIRIRREGLNQRLTIERQLLARLSHRNIARLIDGGTTEDGHAYLVMEWISGRDLDEFLRDETPNLATRLDLFEQMATAAAHAHQCRVVHSDLKPSNVRVNDEGSVRLVDFGVAQLLEERDGEDAPLRALTPAFAAPELLAGEPVSTQSDVWSLGAMLYWLLTDTLLERRPGGDDGSRLPDAIPRREDLAAVIDQATADEPRDRYGSVSALVEDLQRYRARFPVNARAPARMYLATRFMQRHRFAVGIAGAVSITLCLALAGAVWQAHRATLERDRAEAQTERALQAEAESTQLAGELEQVVEFQAEQLSSIDALHMGSSLRESIVDRHRVSLERSGLAGEALRRRVTDAQDILAQVNFTDLARDTLRENIFDNALDAMEEQFGGQPLVRARLMQSVAVTMRALGLNRQAAFPQGEALAIRREWLGNEHPDTLDSVNRMGRQLAAEGKREASLAYYREAMTGFEALHGPQHPATLTALANAGTALEAMGRYIEAEPYFREALQGRRAVLGEDHPDTLISVSNMAGLLGRLDRPDEALPLYREALGKRRQALGDDHPDTLRSINNLGVFLAEEERFDEAEPYYLEALERRRQVLGREHPQTLISANNMGYLMNTTGRLEESERHYREALSISRKVRGDSHPMSLIAMSNLAALLHELDRYEDAEALAAEAVDRGRRSLDEGHWYLGVFMNRHGRELAALELYDQAVAVLLESHQIFVDALGAEDDNTKVVVQSLAEVYARWHEFEPEAGHDRSSAQWQRRLNEGESR
ncbi:tetratricopeptide repeat protein [Wenzhouxiangella sp. EGI_FJ10305]|uniref:tetratricopeptide repeat protein n=1 Tax=Wenzhouxiangella sp. EGI_FJ10305 TaxID=3243768 RepID=UPI0035E2E361